MVTSLVAEIEVDAPIGEVYQQWTQVESFPEYLGAVWSVLPIDRVRSRWAVNLDGFTEEFYADIVEQTPERRIEWQSTDGVFHRGLVELAESGESTRVTLRMEWEPEGMLESFGASVGVDPRQAEQDLQRFKQFVETRRSSVT